MSIANIIILSVPWRDVSRETVYRFQQILQDFYYY